MIPVNPSPSTRRVYTRRIVDAWKSADARAIHRGYNWYHEAREHAWNVGHGDTMMGAGVIAALSANKSWPENLKLAYEAADGNVHGHVADALNKVRLIQDGADPTLVLPDSKTGHFYRCIVDPFDPDPVVIDRHAHDIAVGRLFGNDDRGLSSKGRYAALAHAYRAATIRINASIGGTPPLTPSQVQATVWVAHVERNR